MSWYRMHRGWMDNSVFRNEAFSRRDAFIWLVENANYKPAKLYAPKGEIEVGRGQIFHSLRFMAAAWKWDESKVRRFLSSLSREKIIDAATDAGQTLITICNYEKYQSEEITPDAANDAATPQHCRGNAAKKKEGKEGKKEKDTAFAFEGSTVRINQEQYDKWADAFPFIPDLKAELCSLDDWMSQQEDDQKAKWFFRVSGALKNRNADLKSRPQMPRIPI